jgi:N-acetylneuraminic acid mutarotase
VKARPNQKRWKSAVLFISSLLTIALPGLAAPWVQTTSLPDGYNSHTLVYASGYLYNIGGSSNINGDQDGTNVFCAQVHNDGTIGAWTNTTSLPEAVLNHASVVANGFVYVFAGYHWFPYTNEDIVDIVTNVVYYAKIIANGSLESWKTANPLPKNLICLSASVWNNTIYAIGGLDEISQLQNAVYSAQIQADGSLSYSRECS